ncbi:hypothetical protein IMSHALPRED_005356 [Imshaugia aleurites]|uniref:2EXR domain-containing protein n=1 Tax=Imshaugia aleurites TaxID=172621 RepID=A0A8H3FCY4_9LECA|nr:hypothetical protein IMSHALPRED_005356 [Imshaugia aleurites]
MFPLQRISHCSRQSEPDDILPLPPPAPPRSRFESLPTELRLEIYSLLLDGKPEYCHLEKPDSGRSYSTPTLHPAILAVNRSISAEAYPILYGENKYLFLGTTDFAVCSNLLDQHLSHRVGLPQRRKPSLLPEHSRLLIKHVAVAPLELERNDWVGRLLQLASTITTLEFDYWIDSYCDYSQYPYVLRTFTSKPTLNASIPAIKSLVTASTQSFRLGVRRRYPVELSSMQLANVNLKGLDNVREKCLIVHKALKFMIEIIGHHPTVPKSITPIGQEMVSVENRVFLHRDLADFWPSDEFTVPAEMKVWIPTDTNGQIVEIGQDRKSITWRRTGTPHFKNNMSYGYWGGLPSW